MNSKRPLTDWKIGLQSEMHYLQKLLWDKDHRISSIVSTFGLALGFLILLLGIQSIIDIRNYFVGRHKTSDAAGFFALHVLATFEHILQGSMGELRAQSKTICRKNLKMVLDFCYARIIGNHFWIWDSCGVTREKGRGSHHKCDAQHFVKRMPCQVSFVAGPKMFTKLRASNLPCFPLDSC